MMMSLHEKAVSFFMTAGLYGMFFVKTCLNLMISSLLGLIVATGVILDTTPMRKTYIVLSLGIILALAVDKNIRNNSDMFDMLGTIFAPVNLGRGMNKVIKYTRVGSCVVTISLLLLEVFKIAAGIYCVVTISVEDIPNTWVTYWILGALLLESALGLILYTNFIVSTIIYKNFYVNMLRSMAKWYLPRVVDCQIVKRNRCIYLHMSEALTEDIPEVVS